MSNYAEMLGLDPEAVLTMAETYSGYAAAREETDQPAYNREWIASSWLIGAVFQTLIEPSAAKPMFQQAAWNYAMLGMPIWRICQVCAGKERDQINEQISAKTYPDDEDAFYQTLQREFRRSPSRETNGSYFQQNKLENELFGTIPNLHIPYGLVLQAINDSNQWYSEKQPKLQNFKQVARRMNEITDLYRSDEYYWQNLQGQIIPFEPAAIAISIVFVKKWLESGNKLETLIKNSGLQKRQSLLLEIAAELLEKPDKLDQY
ncbi:hypothetical protein DBR43_31680 [Pedobacter sp. KBW06]|uniref:hypothetical protein n=1 Tax=Pedobacter sp. KBW06 TaxID=2153359 RepID=UPI000F5ADF80|nr:hypothetical protein [Pedobacter sp. KBW06]RQO64842.1 hypothetical protein DBR43_31680 [Pedobacter sp. KBW06]